MWDLRNLWNSTALSRILKDCPFGRLGMLPVLANGNRVIAKRRGAL